MVEANTSVDAQLARNRAVFDELASAEAEHFRWQREKVELIANTVQGMPKRGVLADIGCFTGFATAQYSAGFEGAVGFDASDGALAAAAARGIEARRWSAGLEGCPASDGEFNVVVAADIIEHIIDTDGFMAELSRILAADGFLIVTTPNLAYWRSRLRLMLGKPPCSYPGPSPTVRSDLMIDLNHIRITTSGEWQALFRASGFRTLDLKGWSIMHAIEGGISIQARQMLDRFFTRVPTLAFGLLFVLHR
ncbi:MAG TPA: methyltransferase domain-containing protein [Candidatus Binataceae bacterium]